MERLKVYFDIVTFRLTAILCCVLPFIVFPLRTKIPYSTGNTFAYKNTIDVFEYHKFLFLIIVSTLMIIFLSIKYFLLKEPIIISKPFLLFLVTVFISTIFSLDPYTSFFGLSTKWQGLITHCCYFISFTFIFNTFNRENTERIIIYILCSSGLIAIISLLNYYGIDIYLMFLSLFHVTFNIDQIKAPIGNRISSGAYFSLTVPLGLFVLFHKSQKYYLLVLIAFLNLSALIVSQTRTAWFGTLLGIIVISAISYKKLLLHKKILAFFAIFLLSTFLILNFTGQNKILERFTDLKTQFTSALESGNIDKFGSMRIFDYKRAFLAIQARPLVGTGPDCFMFYGVLTPKDKEENPEWRYTSIITKAHSEYLEIASTIGIPALLLYLIFLINIFYRHIKFSNKQNYLQLALFAGLTSYLIQAAANIGVISVLPIFFTMLAIISKLSFLEENNDNFLFTIK